MIRLFEQDFRALFHAKNTENIDLKDYDFSFDYATTIGDYERIVLTILNKLDSGTLSQTGDITKWERGWQENLDEYRRCHSLKNLVPKYVHSDQPCRLFRQYIYPISKTFEADFFAVLREWLFKTYMNKPCSRLVEVGSGSGYNLPILANMYPGIDVWGLDWAQASVEIANEIHEFTTLPIFGCRFNIFEPDYSINLFQDSNVVTFGCLEQAGDNYKAFVQYLLHKKPGRIVNVEPIIEFYTPTTDLSDYLATKFHTQRNYLGKYYTYLKELEQDGKIRIVKSDRIEFGSLYHDGWSIIVWEII